MKTNDLFEQWRLNGALDNKLSDDDCQITYREAMVRIELYKRWLLTREFNQPIAFFCEQSVEHMLFTLALMATELNFVQLSGDVSEQDYQAFGDRLVLNAQFEPSLQHVQHQVSQNASIQSIADRVYFRTSGSLGVPKIVVHHRQTLVNNSRHVLTRLPLNAGCRVLIPVPIYHMYGFGAALWPSLLVGANIYLTSGLNILKFRTIEREFMPNVLYLTPPTVGALLLRPSDDNHYHFIVSAGDCFDIQQFQQAKAKFNRIFNLYGSTELGVIAIGEMQFKGGHVDDRVKALDKVEFKVERNQLLVNHPFSFDFYLHQQQSEPFFKTGDLVQRVDSGRFRVIGRSKLSVNREGRLIAFSDLETQIRQHEAVSEVAVVKGPKDAKGHTIVAIVEVSIPLDCDELRKELGAFLPLFATPSKIIIESKLPRLCNGKINRKQIAQYYEEIEV